MTSTTQTERWSGIAKEVVQSRTTTVKSKLFWELNGAMKERGRWLICSADLLISFVAVRWVEQGENYSTYCLRNERLIFRQLLEIAPCDSFSVRMKNGSFVKTCVTFVNCAFTTTCRTVRYQLYTCATSVNIYRQFTDVCFCYDLRFAYGTILMVRKVKSSAR